jgi:dephospho-CoA kinase
MLAIGLTGGIATGKSYVLERFREHGVPCLDADVLAHGVMTAGTEATRQIADRFGPAVIGSDGAVDRSRLGPLVFDDESARKDLEAIVHPAVYRAITAGLRGLERMGHSPFAVVDVPLLYETGHAADFDKVIVTFCPVDLQIERLRARGLSAEQVRQRLAAQWPASEKVARADYVIRTDGTFADTDEQCARVLESLRALALT